MKGASTAWLEGLGRDLRLGVRGLRRSPGFAAMAVVTLALGIGANTATFSVVDAVLLRRLPYPEPDRIVAVSEVGRSGRSMRAAWANFHDWRERSRSFQALAAYWWGATTVLGGERPEVARVASVSEDFFAVLGATPSRGRLTAPDEHRPGADPVALVSQAFWRGALGGRVDETEALSGRRLTIGPRSYRIVGVLPQGFDFPGESDVWVPIELDEPSPYRSAHNYYVVGRLAPGKAVTAAEAELQGLTESIVATATDEDPEYLARGARVRTLRESVGGPVRAPLLILLGAAGLVLLVACCNLAGAALARGVGRRRELAVRRALGASRGRLVAQLLTEGLVVALLGAAAGLVVARLVLDALLRLAPGGVPRLDEVRLDATVLGFTLAVSVATALLFGLFPALRLTRRGPAGDLAGGARGGTERGQRRTWNLLVGGEVALALILLAGSGLLIRSFWRVLDEDLGFVRRAVAVADVRLPDAGYPEFADVTSFYDRLAERLAAVPEVAAAGVTSALPLADPGSWGRIDVEGGPRPTVDAAYRVTSAGYFPALGIPLLRGRLFDQGDRDGAPHVALVNRALAEAAWPGEDPIGKALTGGGMDELSTVWATVVGVVGDVRERDPTLAPYPTVFFSYSQRPAAVRDGTVVVKAAGAASVAGEALRGAITAVDPEVPAKLGSMEEVHSQALVGRRFALLLLVGFAAIAAMLAAVGIFEVVAYGVARRRRELAIRLALGAAPSRVRNQVVARSMAVVAVGLAAGLAGALAATRLLASQLYRVAVWDAASFAAGLGLLAAVGLAASFLPARRASNIDPLESLRAE